MTHLFNPTLDSRALPETFPPCSIRQRPANTKCRSHLASIGLLSIFRDLCTAYVSNRLSGKPQTPFPCTKRQRSLSTRSAPVVRRSQTPAHQRTARDPPNSSAPFNSGESIQHTVSQRAVAPEMIHQRASPIPRKANSPRKAEPRK
jgi:hypothetical protein